MAEVPTNWDRISVPEALAEVKASSLRQRIAGGEIVDDEIEEALGQSRMLIHAVKRLVGRLSRLEESAREDAIDDLLQVMVHASYLSEFMGLSASSTLRVRQKQAQKARAGRKLPHVGALERILRDEIARGTAKRKLALVAEQRLAEIGIFPSVRTIQRAVKRHFEDVTKTEASS